MRDGFVRVAVGTPAIRVADCEWNSNAIIGLMREAGAEHCKLLVLPELCVTGCTAGDLLLQKPLLAGALDALARIRRASAGLDVLLCCGAPLALSGRLYNCAVFVQNGRVLAVVPKRSLPDYGSHAEQRLFTLGPEQAMLVSLLGEDTPFGSDIVLECAEMPEFVVGAEFGDDVCAAEQIGAKLALAGAAVLCVPSADAEIVGAAEFRRTLLRGQSARLRAACLYANAGEGESSTDLVFSGHNIVAENGKILTESVRYTTGLTVADIDVGYIDHERRRVNMAGALPAGITRVPFHVRAESLQLRRTVDAMPFVPADPAARDERCAEIFAMQAHGLATRLKHIGCKKAVLAVSGGLDSTLALLVTARAFDLLGLDHAGIHTLTMPCFGTTGRTRSNAQIVSERLGTTFSEIRIEDAVRGHFRDIGHSEDDRDATYENAQARERTQVLMDIANQTGAIAIGTGDLSELALGWATYNGDHMSMYGVNASVPKTLVRHLVAWSAARADDAELAAALRDIVDTPVSPELLPPKQGEIAQKTEDLVGPYELHDFFLYHMLRRGETAEKTARLADIAFEGRYSSEIVRAWLRVFARRFFSQQFKRSCMPDGPKVGSVALSPRGDLRMPSDACGTLWQIQM